jgi:HEAT repeat protein
MIDNIKLYQQKSPAIVFFMLFAAFCIASSVLTSGCNESSKNAIEGLSASLTSNKLAEAEEIILQSLSDEEAVIQVNAIEIVAKTHSIKFMPQVRRMLKSPIVPVRFASCLAIGDLRYSLAGSDIELLMKDRNENVRIAAGYAAYRLGSEGSYKLLVTSLKSPDQTVRANAAMLLGKSGNKQALKHLWYALSRTENSDPVKYQATEAIAMLGDSKISQKLWALLISKYAEDRIDGVRAMGSLGGEQAQGALITNSLEDHVVEVRLAGAEQLAAMGNNSGESVVIEVFRKKLADQMDPRSQERVKVFAAHAIGELGTPRVTKFLPKLLKDPSKFVRLAAAKAVIQSSKKVP